MNYKYFELLTKSEADEYLNEFLLFGRERGMELLRKNTHFTIDLDFGIESLPLLVRSLIGVLKTIRQEIDLSLPEFIRNTDSYEKTLFEFDEESKSIVLAVAYYLGETLVRNYSHLSWATGNTKFAQGNMPVVSGFKSKDEMPTIVVAENMFRKIFSGLGKDNSVEISVNTWNEEANK
jgi:hypothetical protein